MPFGLLKYGLTKDYPTRHHFTPATALKKHYDVVIIGAGGHGTAIAYYLAKYHGVTNVDVHPGQASIILADCRLGQWYLES